MKANLITDIDDTIKENWRRNIREVVTELNVSIGTIHNILHDQPTLFFADGIRNGIPNGIRSGWMVFA